MGIPTIIEGESTNVFWDGGSTCNHITFQKAKKLQLSGKPTMIKIRTVGEDISDAKIISSAIYAPHLLNKEGTGVPFKLYGVKTISNDVLKGSMDDVKDLFPNTNIEDVIPIEGEIDVLIGIGNAPKQ